MSIFGNIISDDDVEDAVIAVLRRWMGTYLAEVERQHGVEPGYYQRPMGVDVRQRLMNFPEDSLPRLIVVSTGTTDSPTRQREGRHRVPFYVAVVAVVESQDAASTRAMAYRYGAAIRACLVQKQSLEGALSGNVRGVDWVDSRNDEIPNDDSERTLWATRQVFTVEVDDVVQSGVGPVGPTEGPVPGPADPNDPDTDPHPDWPVVPDRAHVQITTERKPINE